MYSLCTKSKDRKNDWKCPQCSESVGKELCVNTIQSNMQEW